MRHATRFPRHRTRGGWHGGHRRLVAGAWASLVRNRPTLHRRRRSSPSAPAACSTPIAGTMINNQIVLIRGDRIVDVGGSVQVPPGGPASST